MAKGLNTRKDWNLILEGILLGSKRSIEEARILILLPFLQIKSKMDWKFLGKRKGKFSMEVWMKSTLWDSSNIQKQGGEERLQRDIMLNDQR